MKINRIRLRNYGGVVEHDVDFTDGVTIVEGANEIGKTSLVKAIDLLLEYPDDSNHRHVVAARPVHVDRAPEAEIDVTAGRYRFTYTKRWSRRPGEAYTHLRITEPSPENVTGREAHDRVRTILAEHADLNLWRALRVQQDQTLDQPTLGKMSALMRALDAAAGNTRDSGTAGGDERNTALIEAVEAEYQRYHTAKRGDPTGVYAKAKADQRTAEEDLQACAQTLDRITATIDEHRGVERDLRDLEAGALTHASTVRELEAHHAALQATAGRIETLRAQAAVADLEARNAAAAVTARKTLSTEADTFRLDAARLAEQAAAADRALGEARECARTANQEAAIARADAGDADEAATLAVRDRDHLRDLGDVRTLDHRLRGAEAAAQAIEAHAGRLAVISVDQSVLTALEKEHQKVVKAQATLEAASPVVEISALDENRVIGLDLNGTPARLPAGQVFSHRLAEDATLTLDDYIRVRISPGNGERDRRAKLATAHGEFAKLCADAGVADIEEARIQAARRGDLEAELGKARAVLGAQLSGDTIDLVREQLAVLHARVDAYRAKRAVDGLPVDLDAADALVGTAAATAERLRSAALEAEALAKEHNAAADRAGIDARVGKQRAEDAQNAADALDRRLASELARESDEALTARRDETASRAEQAATSLNDASATFDAGELEAAAARLLNEKGIARRREEETRQKKNRRAELTGILAGNHDAQEKYDDAAARHEAAQRRYDAVHRQAEAARLLHTTINRERDEAKRAYVEPFRRKVEEFARVVFGERLRLSVDENLAITDRTLGDVTVSYEQLSSGAREQLALCARLACAALVDPADGVPVVIDDALGFTDPDRLHRLGTVFTMTESRSQIIVLTCTPERYRCIGAATVRQLRRASPSASNVPAQRADGGETQRSGTVAPSAPNRIEPNG